VTATEKKPRQLEDPAATTAGGRTAQKCDRCGEPMIGRNCKIVCLNCGYRFDCSDLTLYFDREMPES
jgi:uncharacterized Zn finger protein (UPF0148 family)